MKNLEEDVFSPLKEEDVFPSKLKSNSKEEDALNLKEEDVDSFKQLVYVVNILPSKD
ncbi:hypothetical protein KHA93_17005 [Bacillus sp. FJAT-49732]|uniref:Uncharacterized protein n=1 Tax=Lederbergia citrisecunda TaxID=2833583 RepID=A0A942TSG0_9BACI|nr:hypothetical protein [Lederbergia citrisecunda]MBS4201337.1 hypothetical protein [Lederbergia citrisecunda]